MTPKLHEAVAVFKALGWENATRENIAQLPTGTAEQKRTALAGLNSGEWSEWVEEGNTYRTRSYLDVDKKKLALFAIRIGVDARRAVNIAYWTDSEMLVSVIAGRGEKFAQDFIRHACVSSRRAHEHTASVFGSVAVLLVDRLDLDIPKSAEYMKDWSAYAAAAMGLKAEVLHGKTDMPGLELIEKRFAEHIMAGVAVGVPATGPFGAVLPAGVERGWLSREKAEGLVFSALDASVRPGDRKVWLGVLDKLGISDDELYSHAQTLIPLLATGDSAAITRLAPVLIAKADDSLLIEILIAAFSAKAKNARQLVLKSAMDRPRPENAEGLAPWLSILAGDADKAIASLSAGLLEKWDISAPGLQEEKAEIRGLWQATPPLWQVPPFGPVENSPEALTELAAELLRRPEVVHDVATERFLATANAVAYRDPEAARTSLRGLRQRFGNELLDFAVCWVKGQTPRYGLDTNERHGTKDPLPARDCVVALHLDSLPCLLSTPSAADLSISVPDLASRLFLYEEAGADALEADLLLALARLDLSTKTPEAVASLQKADVPVVLQSGTKLPATAGETALAYLDDPVKEPPMEIDDRSWWREEAIAMPDSLRGFPDRLHSYNRYHRELFAVFPFWGDAAMSDARWDCEVYHQKGLILRQIARRAAPLPPGASVNFLAAQRSHTPDAAQDSILAVTEAWQRGLLRPGASDVAMLDWSASLPRNLAALAEALGGIAGDGLLSVVWPVFDGLIAASLRAPRLLAGTAELAGYMLALLPEVESAVEKGIADKDALRLPGIRALAKRSGSSCAVSTAQEIAGLLPAAEAETHEEETPEPVMDEPFDEVWPVRKEKAKLIEDGAKVTVDWADPDARAKFFLFTLTLPGISDRVFQIEKPGWYYDIQNEGQCEAWVAPPGTAGLKKGERVWLHWDIEQKAMAITERNWVDDKSGPLNQKGMQTPPLPFSLLTVIIGLLAQDGDAAYFAPRLLRKFIGCGQIDETVVRRAAQTLLLYPVVSPAKLVRTLEKDIKLLPVLWPMLTECTKTAGTLATAESKPPVWANRVLGAALRFAPYLSEAAKRGSIPAEDARWAGLSEIASSKAKSAAVEKAKKLMALLG